MGHEDSCGDYDWRVPQKIIVRKMILMVIVNHAQIIPMFTPLFLQKCNVSQGDSLRFEAVF